MNQVVLFILNIFYIQLYLFRDESIAVETPVIAGGIFAVHKDWFVRLGLYDEGMQASKQDHRETSRDILLRSIVSTENHNWSFWKVLFIYMFSTQPYAKKLCALLLNNNKIGNKIIFDLEKLQGVH